MFTNCATANFDVDEFWVIVDKNFSEMLKITNTAAVFEFFQNTCVVRSLTASV